MNCPGCGRRWSEPVPDDCPRCGAALVEAPEPEPVEAPEVDNGSETPDTDTGSAESTTFGQVS